MIEASHCNNCSVEGLGLDPILDYQDGIKEGIVQFHNSDFCHLCEVDKYDALFKLKTGRDRITTERIISV